MFIVSIYVQVEAIGGDLCEKLTYEAIEEENLLFQLNIFKEKINVILCNV